MPFHAGAGIGGMAGVLYGMFHVPQDPNMSLPITIGFGIGNTIYCGMVGFLIGATFPVSVPMTACIIYKRRQQPPQPKLEPYKHPFRTRK